MKTVLFSLLFAFIARLALAIPPACLIHAVNTQNEPGNLSAVCGNGAMTVQSYMADNCGKSERDAQQAFIATCSSAGTSVAAYTATATSSRASGTGSVTASRSSGSATGTAGSTQSTAGAHAYYRGGKGSYAAAAVALVGAVAAL